MDTIWIILLIVLFIALVVFTILIVKHINQLKRENEKINQEADEMLNLAIKNSSSNKNEEYESLKECYRLYGNEQLSEEKFKKIYNTFYVNYIFLNGINCFFFYSIYPTVNKTLGKTVDKDTYLLAKKIEKLIEIEEKIDKYIEENNLDSQTKNMCVRYVFKNLTKNDDLSLMIKKYYEYETKMYYLYFNNSEMFRISVGELDYSLLKKVAPDFDLNRIQGFDKIENDIYVAKIDLTKQEKKFFNRKSNELENEKAQKYAESFNLVNDFINMDIGEVINQISLYLNNKKYNDEELSKIYKFYKDNEKEIFDMLNLKYKVNYEENFIFKLRQSLSYDFKPFEMVLIYLIEEYEKRK